MTKKELAQKMRDFLDAQDDDEKNEWYLTERDLCEEVIERFAVYLGYPPKDAVPVCQCGHV